MDFEMITTLISSLGFPIVCVLGLAAFVVYVFKEMNETNKQNMAQVQIDCKAREEKLYNEIIENRKINAQFAEIIAKYESKLDVIKDDVKDIKDDITEIRAKSH